MGTTVSPTTWSPGDGDSGMVTTLSPTTAGPVVTTIAPTTMAPEDEDGVTQIPEGYCELCTDPTTVGQNLGGSTYIGSNNAQNYNHEDTNTAAPIHAADSIAFWHDIRYDMVGAKGAGTVLTNVEVIGADLKFIFDQTSVVYDGHSSLTTKAMAAISAAGISVMAAPKIMYKFLTTAGSGSTMSSIMDDFKKSNINTETGESIYNNPGKPNCDCGN